MCVYRRNQDAVYAQFSLGLILRSLFGLGFALLAKEIDIFFYSRAVSLALSLSWPLAHD